MAEIKSSESKAVESSSDGTLISAYLAGDQAALELLFERYRRPLYSYLNRLFNGDTNIADDVFQECWLKILKGLPKFKDMNSFSAWSFRIAHNQAMQHFRKHKIQDKVGALTSDGELPETGLAETANPEQKLAGQEIANAVEEALQKLPTEQREVFLLRQNGVAFKEIAQMQNCPINTALSRMRYVVLFLREELAEIWQNR